MNKVIYVKAYFCPLVKEVTVKVPTGEVKKGLLGFEKKVLRKEKQLETTGWSDCEIDGQRLTEDLQKAIESLNKEGYLVKTITPISSGRYNYNYEAKGVSTSYGILDERQNIKGGSSFGYGYGYSYTESLIILATKNA